MNSQIRVHPMRKEEVQKEHTLKVLFPAKWRVNGEKCIAWMPGLKDKTLFVRMNKPGAGREDYLKRRLPAD